MITKNERIAEDVKKFGPAQIRRIHKLSLRGLVETITGIDTSCAGNSIIDQTLEKERIYHESGLAIHPFPTYWHRELMSIRTSAKKNYTDIEKELKSVKNREARSVEESKQREEMIGALESCLKGMDYLYFGIPKNFMYNMYGVRISGTLNRDKAYSSLICQFENNDNVCEVYSEGGYSISVKAYKMHKYIVMSYDKKTGDKVSEKEISRNNFLLTIAATAVGGYYFGPIGAIVAFGGTSLVAQGLGLSHKKIFERRLIRKAQEQWELKNK